MQPAPACLHLPWSRWVGVEGKKPPSLLESICIGGLISTGVSSQERPQHVGVLGCTHPAIPAWLAGPVVCPPIAWQDLPSSLGSCPQAAHHSLYLSDPKGLVSHASSIQHCAQTSHHATRMRNCVVKLSSALHQNRGPVTR